VRSVRWSLCAVLFFDVWSRESRLQQFRITSSFEICRFALSTNLRRRMIWMRTAFWSSLAWRSSAPQSTYWYWIVSARAYTQNQYKWPKCYFRCREHHGHKAVRIYIIRRRSFRRNSKFERRRYSELLESTIATPHIEKWILHVNFNETISCLCPSG